MNEQIGRTLRFYAFYTESKLGKTGLTVTVNVRKNGTPVVTGGSASEEGDGLYYYDLASGSVDAAGAYTAVFKTATTSVDLQDNPALWVVGMPWVENLDEAMSSRAPSATAVSNADLTPARAAKLDNLDATVASRAAAATAVSTAQLTSTRIAKLDNLDVAVSTRATSVAAGGGGTVIYQGPVAPGGNVTLKRGDDYYAADSRSLIWSTTAEDTWPDLTAATITFYAQDRITGEVFSKTGGVTTPTGSTKVVYVELTTTETEAISDGVFDVQATLSNGHIVTLASGTLTSLKNLVV